VHLDDQRHLAGPRAVGCVHRECLEELEVSRWGHDEKGHITYAFSAKSFWCISSAFLSPAERVSSSAAFLR